jgi:hypothetical protein
MKARSNFIIHLILVLFAFGFFIHLVVIGIGQVSGKKRLLNFKKNYLWLNIQLKKNCL